jgi:hypothetical protein
VAVKSRPSARHDAHPGKVSTMKTAFIASLFAVAAAAGVAATAATEQLTAPNPQNPPDAVSLAQPAPTERHANHALLRADRERVKADKERLKTARAARDDTAIRDAQTALQTDMGAWHADRERLKQ